MAVAMHWPLAPVLAFQLQVHDTISGTGMSLAAAVTPKALALGVRAFAAGRDGSPSFTRTIVPPQQVLK